MYFIASIIAEAFLPHSKTGRRAKLIRHKAFAHYIFILLVFLLISRSVNVAFPGVLGYASDIKSSDLLKFTNEERRKNNKPVLELNSDLSRAAEAKARDMFKNDYWAHVSPKGTEPWYFFNSVGYDYVYAGENLAKNFTDSKGVVNAWMNSTSHRDNILNQNYTQIGFAVVNGELNGYKTTLVVQFFGKPRGLSEKPAVIDSAAPKATQKVESVAGANKEEIFTIEGQNPSARLTGEASKPFVDIYAFSRTFLIVFALFISFMFGLDFWYSSKLGLAKFSGHTLAHIFMLLTAVISLALIMIPGKVG
ncbi:MAG: CAP domain-containing protein [Patescibacteria group bacterium]